MSAPLTDTEAIDRLLALLPMSDDGTGHVADCGWSDEVDWWCDCVTLRSRMGEVLAARQATLRESVAQEIEEEHDQRFGWVHPEDAFSDGLLTAASIARGDRS